MGNLRLGTGLGKSMLTTAANLVGKLAINFQPGQVLAAAELNAIQQAKADVLNGAVQGMSIDATSSLATLNASQVSVANILLDAHALRAAGCMLDGKTDDGPAINAVIANVGSTVAPGMPAPTVAMQLPAGTSLLIGTTLQTGTVSLSISGGGIYNTFILMKSGGAGVIQHGTVATPAVGTLQIRDVGVVDLNVTGSGCAAITTVFSPNLQLFGCLPWSNVFFRYFSQVLNATNVPRDTVWFNVKAAGPDGVVQSLPAFQFTGTSANAFGNFNGVFVQCAAANYSYGWEYNSAVPWEGQRFYSCDAYNGWGMIKVYINPKSLSGEGVSNYQALGWLFNGCDYQGMGFALDLYGCRMVRIDNFYCALNTMPSGQSIPPAPDGTARTYRNVMSFRNCGDVKMTNSNIEDGGNLDSTSTMVFVNSDVSYFRAHGMTIFNSSQITACLEYASGNTANVCGAFDTYWAIWVSGIGACVLDHGANQINKEAVRYASGSGLPTMNVGNVDTDGVYEITQVVPNISLDSNNRVAVTFPTRYGTTNPVFIGGAPLLKFSITGADTSLGTAIQYDLTSTGFTIQFQNSTTATHGISYTAKGP